MVAGEMDDITFKLLECVKKCLNDDECRLYAMLMFGKEVMKELNQMRA